MRIDLKSLIDPEVAAYEAEAREYAARVEAERAAGPQPDLRTPEGLARARAALTPRPAPPGPPAVELLARAEGREVPVRVLLPADGEVRGVHLDIFGGGFYMGWAARSDGRNRRLVEALGIAVVAVDYRLAPENPWPAAPDDCETAALWLLKEAEGRFGTGRLTIGGASAGGNLAMTTLLRLRERGLAERFAGNWLLYGAFDLSGMTPAGRRVAGEFFIEAYVGGVEDRTDPDISPIFGDLRGLPPALIVVGSEDLLFEGSLAMAARLVAAGVEVDLRVYPGCPHGFASQPTAMADAALRGVESWLGARFA